MMKKLLHSLLAVACSALMFVGVVSCGKNDGSQAGTAVKEAKVKIGILAPAVTHGWVAAVAFYAENRCRELGEEVDYKVLTSSNAEEMTAQLDELQAWKADAVVVYPQWTGMEVPIGEAIKAGAKVVNFDIEIAVDGIYMVSGDNESMGVESAKYIVDKCGKDITVAVMEVPTAGSVSALRVKGFMDTMAKIAPEAKLLRYATKFTREDGLKDFADVLTANEKLDAVFSLDDETSIGIIQALEESGRKDVQVVTGGGGCQEYFKLMQTKNNLWIQSALYSPSMVMVAVDKAFELANGLLPDARIVIPTKVVDRNNCAEYLNAKSPY